MKSITFTVFAFLIFHFQVRNQFCYVCNLRVLVRLVQLIVSSYLRNSFASISTTYRWIRSCFQFFRYKFRPSTILELHALKPETLVNSFQKSGILIEFATIYSYVQNNRGREMGGGPFLIFRKFFIPRPYFRHTHTHTLSFHLVSLSILLKASWSPLRKSKVTISGITCFTSSNSSSVMKRNEIFH